MPAAARSWYRRAMPRVAKLVVLAASLGLPWAARAVTPCHRSAPDAIAAAELVFVGRIVAVRELERQPPCRWTFAAEVVVYRCLVGAACKREAVALRFPAETCAENGLGADLQVGVEYLFALRRDAASRGEVEFDTRWGGSCTDMAYTLRPPLEPVEDLAAATWHLESIWRMGTPVTASLADVERWAAERRGAARGARPSR